MFHGMQPLLELVSKTTVCIFTKQNCCLIDRCFEEHKNSSSRTNSAQSATLDIFRPSKVCNIYNLSYCKYPESIFNVDKKFTIVLR